VTFFDFFSTPTPIFDLKIKPSKNDGTKNKKGQPKIICLLKTKGGGALFCFVLTAQNKKNRKKT